MTSSIAAHAIAVLPRSVPVRPRSAMIRASTGNAVMLIATAVKSANTIGGTCAGGEPLVQVERQHDPQAERHRDAGVADDDSGARPLAQPADVELHADREHEQDHAELAEELQERKRRRREEGGLDRGKPPTEERRPEQNARGHLADDGGLTELPEEHAGAARDRDDDQELEQEEEDRRGHRFGQASKFKVLKFKSSKAFELSIPSSDERQNGHGGRGLADDERTCLARRSRGGRSRARSAGRARATAPRS